MKKETTPVEFNQEPAQGDHTDDDHASRIEAEVAAHGLSSYVIPSKPLEGPAKQIKEPS